MSKHDDILNGLGLHGQAIVVSIEMIEEILMQNPDLSLVADRIGVPISELRPMFSGNDELLIAVAEQGLVHLVDSCTKAIVKIDPADPIRQFLALGSAYIRWASDHTLQFRLITSHPRVNAMKVPHLRRYIDSIYDLMTKLLKRAQENGSLPPEEDITMTVMSSRTFAYGLAGMVVDGRMADADPGGDPLKAADRAFADFVARFTTSPKPQE